METAPAAPEPKQEAGGNGDVEEITTAAPAPEVQGEASAVEGSGEKEEKPRNKPRAPRRRRATPRSTEEKPAAASQPVDGSLVQIETRPEAAEIRSLEPDAEIKPRRSIAPRPWQVVEASDSGPLEQVETQKQA